MADVKTKKTDWIVDFNRETDKAFRTTPDGKNKSYTSGFSRTSDATALSPVWAHWPDGHKAFIAQVTCHDIWPSKYPLEMGSGGVNLPPKKKGKKQRAVEALWDGEKDSERVHLVWRSSRGWQLSLYHGKPQVCQLKMVGLVVNAACGKTIQDASIALMKELAASYVAGTVGKDKLSEERDRLLPLHGLEQAFGSTKKKSLCLLQRSRRPRHLRSKHLQSKHLRSKHQHQHVSLLHRPLRSKHQQKSQCLGQQRKLRSRTLAAVHPLC